jgi:hypothetical protein
MIMPLILRLPSAFSLMESSSKSRRRHIVLPKHTLCLITYPLLRPMLFLRLSKLYLLPWPRLPEKLFESKVEVLDKG